MSLLPRSIPNSLLIAGDDENDDDRPTAANDDNHHLPQSVPEQEFNGDEDGSDPQTLTTRVKGDLSDLTDSLARQLFGVASFLAPPPPPPPPPLPPLPLHHSSRSDTSVSNREPGDPSVSREEDRDDISNSNCEESRFGGETGISNSCTFPNDDQAQNDTHFVGVTDEVLSFAMNIAHHPETWLDFPLSEEEDSDDFEMSDTQWNHATMVEHLVPRLSALRIELCPIHMSESYFWMVYFVLLHSRLNKRDAHLLSTPQIVAARSMWMKELQRQTKSLLEGNKRDMSDVIATSSTTHDTSAWKETDLKSDDATVSKTWSQKVPNEKYDDDEDDNWIHENKSELDGYNGSDRDHEDISFSDLEDDDCTLPVRSDPRWRLVIPKSS